MTTWKHAERRVAQLVGGRRVPVNGRGGQPDVTSSWCAAEVKTRKSLPQWLKDALRQARAGARDDQVPVVVLHELGTAYRDGIVCLSLQDFVDWYGDPLETAGDDLGAIVGDLVDQRSGPVPLID